MPPTALYLFPRQSGPQMPTMPWRPFVAVGIQQPAAAPPSSAALSARDVDNSTDRVLNILLAVLGVVFFLLLVASTGFLLVRSRRRRQRRRRNLDAKEANDDEEAPPYSAEDNKHRSLVRPGLTIETTHKGRSSILVIRPDGQPMLQNPDSPPHSPDNVPEIRITFPDEHDDEGRCKSGRVLVVRVGDNAALGLEPLVADEQLPAYEKEAKGPFRSIDMDRIGGLKEKDPSQL